MQQGSKAIHYGSSERWKLNTSRVTSIFGQSTSTKVLQVSEPIFNRRPPDTSAALIKVNKKVVGGKHQRNRSQQKTKVLIKAISKKPAGKKSDNNTNRDIHSLPEKYQSYPHFGNSCYITAPLEALYACYIRDQGFWIKNISHIPLQFGLKRIYDSFIIRDQASGSTRDITNAMTMVCLL